MGSPPISFDHAGTSSRTTSVLCFDKLYALNGQAFQRLNEALVTLIPKRPDAATLFDYRPISLIHIVAKLFAKFAVTKGIIRRLTDRLAASSISLFADDVVIFCHPDPSELAVVSGLLDYFGAVSGLRTNVAKCSAAPIQCTPEVSDAVGSSLTCPVVAFPIQYLGLPLSLRKVPASHLLPLIDKLLRKLATWKAALLSRGERLALVWQVLMAMPMHILLAMLLSPPILKKANRIIRDFLWHGRRDARAGSCLVSWAIVCHPIELGGLGIRDLHRTGISLRV
ncbi:uncharacterized protein [Aegilops tauschii subsp. strangulata]|uniref:uncharacterized protein n=1 Tax=Aegilops tauschii subsp. strangulata TaxID=200361 RepID=UPI003CC87DC3